MFHVYGVQGRMFSGTLEALRQHRAVSGIVRVQRAKPAGPDTRPPTPALASNTSTAYRVGQEATRAYGQATISRVRKPLRSVEDVMRSPAVTVRAAATLHEAWQLLARHGIGQAPVVDDHGNLVGLVGRAELMPAASREAPDMQPQANRLALPVATVMWSPVPSAEPGTDLRRVASLLLDTGLPGVPVADAAGIMLGFVSRTDLLRALATDPPLDLWG